MTGVSRRFLDHVDYQRIWDTKKFRYVRGERNGRVEIMRIPLRFLDTTAAISSGWEMVAFKNSGSDWKYF